MKVLKTEQCPSCSEKGLDTSQDNLAVYVDGKYCFSCGYTEKKAEEKPGLIQGTYQDIENRGISKKTCEFFGYQVGRYTGYLGEGTQKEYVTNIPVHISNYYNNFGVPIAQKIRDSKKRMKIIGSGKERGLYGQWLWEPSFNVFVTVVEGEIDALSIIEVQGVNYPVLSIKDGAAGAKSSLQQHLEWLQKWKYVVLGFDNDEAGQKAIQECLELFEPGKVKVATWPQFEMKDGKLAKDANDLLRHGRGGEIRQIIFNAREIKPDDIVTYADIEDKIFESPKNGWDWPWETLTKLTYGIQREGVITIMSGPAIGKTEFVTEVFCHLIEKYRINVGVLSFEQSPEKTYRRVIGKFLKKRIHVPGVVYDKEKAREIGKDILDKKLYCYERAGAVSWENVRRKIIYYVKGLDCKVIVIDNLSNIAAKFDKDERRGIDMAMLEMQELARTLHIPIFLVCHVTPDKTKKAIEEGGRIRITDARGSSGIGNHSDYVFGLERDTTSEDRDVRSLLIVRILKDKEFGELRGCTFFISYNFETGCLEEIKDVI